MKKIFTLFAALTMVMSMSAATKTIYFKTQLWWHKDDAASAAYYWDPSAAPTWPGIRMTKVDGVADMWSVDVDTDKYKNIIFTRVNGSGDIADWGAKTQDLVIPTDDKNLFTLSTTEVWGGSGASGTWSVYVPDAPKSYKDITIVVTANATPKIHYWEGGDKVVGTDWENLPTMTAAANPNEYTYTIKDVDEATGVKYLIVVGDIQSADQLAFENVNKNFKELLPQVSVMGVTGWDGDKMTVADDYLSASVTLNLKAATDYELKLTVNGQWYGSNAITITKDNNSASFAENGEGNGKLTTDLAGDYVFTYTYATKTLVVTYPVPTPTYTVTVVDATVSTGTYSIDLAGTWEERTVTIQLWQDNVQGFGEYAANAETGYTCQLGNPYAELTPTTAGLYADNGDGTFTFTATMTDTDGGIYNISVSGDNPVVEPETKELEGFTAFAKEEGSLSVYYAAEDWSQFLELYIENYTGYGEYEVSDVYYGDVTGDYGMSGSVTIGYDEDAETDVLTATLTTSDGSLIVLVTLYDKAATMPLMITNLRTEQVGAYLQLTGRNDMDDADVMLFLNDYTGEDKAYEVDTENSFMTYGGIELTVLDGSLTKSVDPEYGDMFTGVVNVYAEEDDMNLALELTMYAAPATNVVVVNAVATYDDNTGALTLTGIWKDAEVSVEIAGYDGKESVEYSGPQGIKFETPDVVAFGNEAEITVAGEDITVVCTASSFHSGDVFNVTITTLSAVGTALDNVTTTVAPAKAIVNGQLVIVKDGVKYNAQGTVVK